MDGILIVDKPQGWTSHDVVNFIRKRFCIGKAGHAGTLDPMATGVLVTLLGRSTKLAQTLTADKKEYKAVLTLGRCTDSQDATGKTTKEGPVPQLHKSDIENALNKFKGEIEQVPPMVSALKVNGRTLYKLARQGKEVERKPRRIFIDQIQLDGFNPPDISFSLVCQKGTYVRTLCEDIAKELGACGHMSYLRRTRSGGFNIEQAVSMEKLKNMSTEELMRCIRQ